MSGTVVLTKTDTPTAPGSGQVALSFPATEVDQLRWVDLAGSTNTISGSATLQNVCVFEGSVVTSGGEVVWQS